MKKPLSLALSALLGASPALAALGGAAGVVIPYAGKLELNGALSTGSFDFQFQVMTDATTATVCATRVVSAVAVTNGEFALTIPAVTESCVAGRDVHLIVAVRSVGGGAFTTLGKQRVAPVLGAMTSGTGDFASGGALSGTSLTVSGNVSGAAGSFSGNVNASAGGFSSSVSAPTGSFTTMNASAGNIGPLVASGSVVKINDPIGAFPWNLQASSSDLRLRFAIGNTNIVSFTTEANSVIARGGFQSNGTPDLAETIPAAGDVEAADVVCADPARAEHVVRCGAGAHGILGVISDGTSSFLINARAHDVDAPLTGAPLVLAGRVPVKVSTENGAIHIGDELTLSSTPGVAMRLTGPAPVVGIALAEFAGTSDGTDPLTGTVLCFVKVADGSAAALARDNVDLRRRLSAIEARLGALPPVVAAR